MAPFECRHAGDWGYENGAQYMYAEYDRVCGMEMPGALWAEQYAPYGDGCQELVEKLQAVLTENNELKTEKGLLEQRLYGASQQLERLKRRLAHWQDVCRKMAKEPAAPEGVPLRKLSGSSETSTAAGSVSSGTIPSKDDHASPQMRPQPPPVSQRVPAAEMIPVLPQQLSPGHALPETNGLNEETVPGIAIPGRAPARVRTARSSADLLSSAKALSRKTATLHMADELLLCIFDSQMDRDWEEAEFECQEPVMALRTTFGAALMARRRLSEAVETPPPPKVAEDWEAEALRWWETAGPDTLA